MLFNTIEFAGFFGIILVLYWALWKKRDLQNLVLLAGGWYFYNKLHYTFPLFLAGMIAVGYLFGRLIHAQEDIKKRKPILVAGIVLLGFGLTYIKYSGLILGNITGLHQWQASALHILVPVGISYYTFCSIGYITDVYRRRIPAETNIITYAAYISFFPHLLSGPIASAVSILPQFRRTHIPTRKEIEQSVGEIIWGLFKKMVIAANIELAVNYCFAHATDLHGSTLFLGCVLFNFYLYADFSAYSELARGIARLLGIELTQNFKMPFFSRNPGEFWRRWHTSLRKWMLDYLYLPLGGNKGSMFQYIMLMLFIFSFSGLWHGANITFVCWGLLNGLYFIPYILTNTLTRYKEPVAAGRMLPTPKEFFQILLTFVLMTSTRIFFRSPDMAVSRVFIEKILSADLFVKPMELVVRNLYWGIPMLAVEWIQREKTFVLDAGVPGFLKARLGAEGTEKLKTLLRLVVYLLVIFFIWKFHKAKNMTEYYYFKF
ncbi:MAG: MBOAT family O-acyltransferase [Bacteroidota bacterium]